MLKPDALKGKTIIITGGGTGLGRSIGKYALQLGANLVICSRKIEVITKTALELQQETGGQVLAVACDVRKYEEVEAVVKTAEERFGKMRQAISLVLRSDSRTGHSTLWWILF